MSEVKGMPICNIVRTEIVTEGSAPKTFTWDTASNAELEPVISAGSESTLRVKNTIYATNRTEDIVTGNDIKFTDNLLIPEVVEIIDGGKLRFDSENPTKVVGYDPPEVGAPVNRTLFTLNVYTEEKDVDGETIKYAKFSYPHCKGKPVKYSLKDGEFFTPEFTAQSRPAKGESPYKLDFIDKLPTV